MLPQFIFIGFILILFILLSPFTDATMYTGTVWLYCSNYINHPDVTSNQSYDLWCHPYKLNHTLHEHDDLFLIVHILMLMLLPLSNRGKHYLILFINQIVPLLSFILTAIAPMVLWLWSTSYKEWYSLETHRVSTKRAKTLAIKAK